MMTIAINVWDVLIIIAAIAAVWIIFMLSVGTVAAIRQHHRERKNGPGIH